jgi:DMSO/TMAO reductase YedYZ molybdopterin-dependent catalytic subunit
MSKLLPSTSTLSASDREALLKDVQRALPLPARRQFGKQLLSLGGLSLLSGCDVTDTQSAQTLLERMSRWNDRVQLWLFDPKQLAPTYSEAQITRPFPFNAYYDEDQTPVVNGNSYRLQLSGLVRDKRPWSLAQLNVLPQADQITRHICVEGWSAIGRWGGTPLHTFLKRIGADLSAKYVAFRCADKYDTSIDMQTALPPQTLIALRYDGRPLPPKYGFPMKIRMPTKLGYKNPKLVLAMEVTNTYPGGYWEDQGYNWFGGS